MPSPQIRPVIAVVMGVSGTGKSTIARLLAEDLGWQSAEGDDFHSAANIAKMHAGHPLTDEDRLPWLQTIADWIGEREKAGTGGVVTCSALKRSYRDLLRAGHPDVRFISLVGSHDLLEDRLEHRAGHFMPASLLDSQLQTLEPLQPDEPGGDIDISQTPAQIEAAALVLLGEPISGVSEGPTGNSSTESADDATKQVAHAVGDRSGKDAED